MTGNLTEFRTWWTSSARYHWLRAMRLRPARDPCGASLHGDSDGLRAASKLVRGVQRVGSGL
jgi:hypothetical protein